MKRKLFAALAIAVAAGLGAALYVNGSTRADEVADDQRRAADDPALDAVQIKRGAYVAAQADCLACHTKQGGRPYAGGYGIQTSFGTINATNITPDRETGIGNWTERDFFRAVRHGKRKDGQLLYPAMPYNAYVLMSDSDMHDLWAYMRSLEPINQAPVPNTLGFPFNIRWVMLGWNLLFFENQGYVPAPDQSAQWNRGRYLVNGAGHCGACHTPKNALGGDTKAYLQGAELMGSHAPEITNNAYLGLGSWSNEEVVRYLKEGSNDKAVAAGAMAEAVEHSTQYLNDADLADITRYLKSLPGSGAQPPTVIAASEPQMIRGSLLYETNCMACHGVHGEGIKGMVPAFADNAGMRSPSGSNLVGAVLKGGRAAATDANVTAAGMPSFDWKLSDSEIADVLTYVRNSWGNAAPALTTEQVAKARAASGALTPLAAR